MDQTAILTITIIAIFPEFFNYNLWVASSLPDKTTCGTFPAISRSSNRMTVSTCVCTSACAKHRLCHGADPQLHPIDRLVDACAEQSLFKIQAQVARGSNPKGSRGPRAYSSGEPVRLPSATVY